jgi:hypothetical protein
MSPTKNFVVLLGKGLEYIVRYGLHALIHNQLVIDCPQLSRLKNTAEGGG